jgi:transcriptional regulator with PAS, ATPase and Fis domain
MVVAPYLVAVIQASDLAARLGRYSILEVDRVVVGRAASARVVRSTEAGRPLLQLRRADGWMSKDHAELVKGDDGWRLSDLGSKNGTFVNGNRVSEVLLSDGDVIEIGATFFLYRDQVSRSPFDSADVEMTPSHDSPFETFNPELANRYAAAEKLAASNLPLLITGETGAGKELVAQEIHRISGRSGAFVPVNSGAIPEALAEGELFGHSKGAFSGAVSARKGLIRSADKGTLFLDELGELAPEVQAKLLRVIESGEVTALGTEEPVKVDVRIIAATHRDLESMISEKKFRQDLLARLRGAEIALPPLRERPEDIGLLATTILATDVGRQITLHRDAARALCLYQWPSNVRELAQILRRAATLMGDANELTREQLPAEVLEALAPPAATDDELRKRLVASLSRHRGNISAVARELGKARVQIRRWCGRLGISIENYRD